MDNNEKLSSGAEWNEKSKELTLTRKEKLPSSLSEIDISMMSGNIVIENVIDDEEPSFTATAIVKGKKKEDDAREECGGIDEAFDIKLDDTSFSLDEKGDDSSDVSNVVYGNNIVMINGRVVSGGGSSESGVSIKKKVVLRIRPDQAKNFSLNNSSGNIDVSNLEGKGKMKTSSGSIEVRSVKGQLSASASSGSVSIDSVVGVGNFQSSSGEVRVAWINGELAAKTSSGAVSIESVRLTKDASITTSSGRVSVGVGSESLRVSVDSNSGNFRRSNDLVVDKDSEPRMGAKFKGHFGEVSRDTVELDVTTSSGSIDIRKSRPREDEPEKPKVQPVVEKMKEGYTCPFCGVENATFGLCTSCGGEVPSEAKFVRP